MTTNKDIEGIIKDNPELQVELLKDMLDDIKKSNKRKHILIILLVILLFAGFIYYQYSFKSFLMEYDYENVIETVTETDNNSKVNNSHNTNAQNNININIPKAKK